MTSRLPPQCVTCARWRSPLDEPTTEDEPTQTCDAYPGGIPDDIWWNHADHRQAQPNDGGKHWVSRDGAIFPVYAFDSNVA